MYACCRYCLCTTFVEPYLANLGSFPDRFWDSVLEEPFLRLWLVSWVCAAYLRGTSVRFSLSWGVLEFETPSVIQVVGVPFSWPRHRLCTSVDLMLWGDIVGRLCIHIQCDFGGVYGSISGETLPKFSQVVKAGFLVLWAIYVVMLLKFWQNQRVISQRCVFLEAAWLTFNG